ncbi:hypothetical protein KDA11_02650 [Candidatus Saccharibacteria bacterium]|nr:hypothetical protein [Candidatus Saccharibacteria bacterium]
MSLDPNFIPPPQSVSETETAKREELIHWFSEFIDDAVVGFIVSGSMGYGANYSANQSSDNVENTLPGKNKMRQDILNEIKQKTKLLLNEAQTSYEYLIE